MTLPLLLIPGMMCDARLYTPQIAALSASMPIHLASASEHDSMAELAADILRHAPPQFALAGLSMGGIIAMEIFAQAPQRVKKLALLDTNSQAEKADVQAKRKPQIARVQQGGLLPLMQDEIIPNYFPENSEVDIALSELCIAMALACGPEVFIRQSLALKHRPDQQDNLRQVKVPTLILCGAGDRLCPIDRHTRLKELIPHAQLEIIENAGHLSTLQQPDKVNHALLQWLSTPA